LDGVKAFSCFEVDFGAQSKHDAVEGINCTHFRQGLQS
jgi:hypothetical protein